MPSQFSVSVSGKFHSFEKHTHTQNANKVLYKYFHTWKSLFSCVCVSFRDYRTHTQTLIKERTFFVVISEEVSIKFVLITEILFLKRVWISSNSHQWKSSLAKVGNVLRKPESVRSGLANFKLSKIVKFARTNFLQIAHKTWTLCPSMLAMLIKIRNDVCPQIAISDEKKIPRALWMGNAHTNSFCVHVCVQRVKMFSQKSVSFVSVGKIWSFFFEAFLNVYREGHYKPPPTQNVTPENIIKLYDNKNAPDNFWRYARWPLLSGGFYCNSRDFYIKRKTYYFLYILILISQIVHHVVQKNIWLLHPDSQLM